MTIARQTKKPAWEPRVNVRILEEAGDGSRPLTATLDHPLVLNVALLSKLDMTAFTKEGLLMVSKLCAVPMIKRDAKQRNRRRAKGAAVRSCVEDEEPSPASEIHSIPGPTLKQTKGKSKTGCGKVDDLFGNAILPEPCRTCGRPEQPERLHSHPPGHPAKILAKPEKPRIVVSKPVPVNYKSVTNRTKTPSPLSEKRSSRPHSARPRTITCYICSREFGTASFPLHEPKCMEKWERENKLLPRDQRRKRPERPSGTPNSEEWNESAWQSSQSALVPCNKCGRTFNPDRLAVHARSCKAEGTSERPTTSPSPTQGVPPRPPTVPCYICGREFGSRSIAIHEPQCLRKWRSDNANLPQALQRPEPQKPDIDISRITGCYICGEQMAAKERMSHERSCLQTWRRANSARPEGERLPEPARPDYRFTESGEVDYHGTWHSIWTNHVESLIPCRQCGRKFFPDRIERHEAACVNLPIKSKTIR